MENSFVHLYQQDNLYQTNAALYQYHYPSSEGYSSLSPASSTDCSGLSPQYIGHATSQESYGNISIPSSSQSMNLKIQPKIQSEKKTKKMKGRLPYSQRQSASEREKMRMRNLSKALQNLRRYLPPSIAPTDKTLTKIETLQLTISYISLLSAQLGLSEEVLEERRQASLQRTRCSHNMSCYMDMSCSLCSKPIKENMPILAPKEHMHSTRAPAVESSWQNMQTSCQMPYELPQHSALPMSSQQNHYPATSIALTQPTNDYYGISHQHMVPFAEYPHSVEVWRTEASHV